MNQVNGKDMRHSTHQEAVAALIANVSLIKLLVRHDPPPKGLQVGSTYQTKIENHVEIKKEANLFRDSTGPNFSVLVELLTPKIAALVSSLINLV